MMDDHVVEILTKGGVPLKNEGNFNQETSLERISRHLLLLESWLGMPEAPDFEKEDMMEDAAPFDRDFYQAIEHFLLQVWNPEEASQKYLDIMDQHRNQTDPLQVSLYNSALSIRVTRLVRFWMDLNVMGTDHMETSQINNENTLTHHLFRHCTVETRPNQKQHFPLIQAIFQHVEQLPHLQSQIYLYTQALRKSGGNVAGHGLQNPQARLAQLQLSQQVTDKLNQEFDNHVKDLEFILGEWYTMGNVNVRKQCRAHLGSLWSLFEARSSGVGAPVAAAAGMKVENTIGSGIDMTLRLLHRILMGTDKKLLKSHEQLLFQHLIPLHRPNSMVLWRDQTSLLDLYHEPLTKCIAILIQKKPDLTGKVIAGLMEPDVWSKGGNTPKLVLLLHEIDTYIGLLPEPIQGNELGDTFPVLLRTLGSCMASENSRLAQRALPFVKNKKFVMLIEKNYATALNILLPFLLRKEPSWNPTVRKMTHNVLTTLKDLNQDQFVVMGNEILSDGGVMSLPSPHQNPGPAGNQQKKRAIQIGPSTNTFMPKDYTVKSAMGGWKPPSRGSASSMPPPSSRPRATGGGPKNPPLGVTGVAPWAMNSSGGTDVTRSRKNPPLGVTGVAPWAMNREGAVSPLQAVPGISDGLSGITEEDSSIDTKTHESESTNQQMVLSGVLAYMEKIKPPEEKKGASEWSKAQMAETPTLLPTLKFHDLVFGHELGSGSFGVVRYARLIDRTTTRSNWPEYAVKVISTEKIKEMGYEASVQRELAVLGILSHPCISRLVSSFQFNEGVYLILEYASKGDLHSLLRKNGSLDHNSTRFVLGEVVSALASIHELGLVYADLKPENIVITETGHIKLTDFGGSRPVTEAAMKLICESAKNLLQELRDGDWKRKAAPTKKKEFDMDEDVEDGKDEFEGYDPNLDRRIEGTTNYLPPEVVLGSFPSLAADSWALGCVMYQCLTGRPPIIDDDDARTKNRIVSFDPGDSKASSGGTLFSDSHASKVEPLARDLILLLLSRDATERPTMNQVAEHEFFQDAGIDVFSLYKESAHPLDVGDVAPPAIDAQWSRRQLSSIWAPQPQAYDTSLDAENAPTVGNDQSNGPIPEGAEASAFFSKSSLTPVVQAASLPPTGR
jgi:serine/threonine protein kinase